MSHIQLNYAFLLFWSIFGELHWKLLFLVKKWLPQIGAQKYSESLFIYTSLKSGKSRGKFGYFVNNPFVQSSKTEQILIKTVFLLKMSHIPPNYAFLLFCIFFGQIHCKVLFLFKKETISERSTEILRKFVFLNKFEKGKMKRKIWICCKQPILFKAQNWTNINNFIFPLKMSHILLNYAFLLFWSIFDEIHWKLFF